MEYAPHNGHFASGKLTVLVLIPTESVSAITQAKMNQWKHCIILTATSVEEIAKLLAFTRVDVVVYQASAARLGTLTLTSNTLSVRDTDVLPTTPAFLCIADNNQALIAPQVQLARGARLSAYVIHLDAIDEIASFLRYLSRCQRLQQAAPTRADLPWFAEDQLTGAATAGEGLRVVLQPQFDLATGMIVGAEAAMRWDHPQLGEMSPRLFAAMATKLNLNLLLFFVTTAKAAKMLRDMATIDDTISMTVAAHAHTLCERDTVNRLCDKATYPRLPAHLLKIELQENVTQVNMMHLSDVLHSLHAFGFELTLNAMQTNAPALGLLSKMPFSELAIDSRHRHALSAEPVSKEQIAAVIEQGRVHGLRVMAKNISAKTDVRWLHAKGCIFGQGYPYAMAMEVAEFMAIIRRQSSLAR